MRHRILVTITILGVLSLALSAGAEEENLLKNPSFEAGFSDDGVPEGWKKYGGRGGTANVEIARSDSAAEGRRGLLIRDGDKEREIGVNQAVKAPKPSGHYRASVKCRKVDAASSVRGAYLQMRFLPSNKIQQTALAAVSDSEFTELSVQGVAPEDTERIMIYLYTHKGPTPQVIVDDVRLVYEGE